MEQDRPGHPRTRTSRTPTPEDPMARPTGSSSRTAEHARSPRNRAGDPAPETDEISGTRADYAPDRRRPEADHRRHDQAHAEGVQRGQPHRLGRRAHLLRRPGAVPGADRAAVDHRPAHRPEDAHRRAHRRRPGERRGHPQPGDRGARRQRPAPAGFGLILGLAAAVWSASGYVGAFTRAANVVYETPEGRKIWKLKPLQLLVTLIGILFAAVILAMLVLSGPVVDADRAGHRDRRDRPDRSGTSSSGRSSSSSWR